MRPPVLFVSEGTLWKLSVHVSNFISKGARETCVLSSWLLLVLYISFFFSFFFHFSHKAQHGEKPMVFALFM